MAPSKSIDRERRRRARAEPDDHPILDKLDRRLRRRALEDAPVDLT
jgi:hypothetical protein